MFAYVNGFLEDATVDNAVIDVNGFGINVRISADTASRLPGIGEEVRLYTYTYVKEDAFLLYGFLSRSDLEMFKLCITVSGIGPKGALAILSVMLILCGLPLCPGMPRQSPGPREWEPGRRSA